MRDPVFTGIDEAAAVAEAARTLGLPAEGLRYALLDPGTPAGRGVPATPARIAVIVPTRASAAPAPPPSPAATRPTLTPGEAVRGVLAALGQAAGGTLDVEAEATSRGERLALKGEATRVLLHDNGEALEALGLLLQRVAANADPEYRLELRCEAVRQRRDEHLREEALAVARAVAQDGRPRPMPSLNAYDRRIVHMAVAEVPGVASQSQGEGRERRVVIAPRPEAANA
jgi:spoIIIJ-associated protein